MASDGPAIGTPEWWVDRLYRQLVKRKPELDKWNAYYEGDHPLPWLPQQAEEEFRRILKMSRSNYMGLVVEAKAERMIVEGFRTAKEQDADDTLWEWWQANNLDADSDQSILESLICGMSYMLVAPQLVDGKPVITVEHASQTIVEYVPGSNRRVRAAGLKVWVDDWTATTCATLYLPDRVCKFEAARVGRSTRQTLAWRPRLVAGEAWPLPNPLGVVSLVELPNNPRMLTGGRSELSDLTDIQDRVNKTLADRLMTQDFGAFPQKWATGYPVEDEDGRPTAPIDSGRDRMVSTDATETKFGQWDAAPLDPYSAAKREDVKDIASRSRTPAQYLLGEMSNVNGETLKASESGLVAAVRQRCRYTGEGLEEVMRLAQQVAGTEVSPDLETIWRNPEFRTEGETVDALVKMATLGVPQTALWEKWGATPQEQEKWKRENRAADPLGGMADLLTRQAGPAAPAASPVAA